MNTDTHNDPHSAVTSREPHAHRGSAAGLRAGSNGRYPLATPPDAELDALADLFLGPTAHSQSHRPTTREPAPKSPHKITLEGVVLGHLPVSAAAWPGQYARTRAEQLGVPVAVVRLGAGTLSVDLFGANLPEHPLPSDADVIEVVRTLVSIVILRVEEHAEAQLPSLPAVNRLCLLTGADDAAIVACYRKLKNIAADADTTGLPLPDIHLTIMGSDNTKATLAYQRIAGAAQAFLDADLLEPVVISRIGPTGSTSLYRGETTLSLEALCDLLTLPRQETRTRSQDSAAPAPVRTPPLDSPQPVTAAPIHEPLPAAAVHPEPRPVPTPPTDTLSALIAGLMPLETRCPLTERIELATDHDGQLHLIAAALTTQPEQSAPDPLSDLLRAAAWAKLNADMLSKAEPGLSTHRDHPPVHFVTDQTSLATSLLDTTIRVHLAIAATPTAFGLVAAPLNG